MRKLVSSYNHNSIDFTWQKIPSMWHSERLVVSKSGCNTTNPGEQVAASWNFMPYLIERTLCCPSIPVGRSHSYDARHCSGVPNAWRPLWYYDTFLHFRSPSTENSNRIGIGSFRAACSVLLFAPCRAVIGLEWQAACTLKTSEPNSLDRAMVLDHLYLLQRMLSVKCLT